MKTIEELQDENTMLQRRIRTQDNLIAYYRADTYSVRRRNHFLVLANRIYVSAIITISIGFVVCLLLL